MNLLTSEKAVAFLTLSLNFSGMPAGAINKSRLIFSGSDCFADISFYGSLCCGVGVVWPWIAGCFLSTRTSTREAPPSVRHDLCTLSIHTTSSGRRMFGG